MKKYITVSIVALVMAGCGKSHEPAASNTAIVRGVAVDDLIVNGLVRAYPANDTSRELARGRTDENGSYTLSVDYNGVAVVEVTCEEGVSRMKNPQTGAVIPCEAGLTLHSASVVKPNQSITLPVTPLTEAIVRQIDGDATPEKLETARNNIGLMFGIDPLGDMPTEGTYSKIIDSIHTVAQVQNISLSDVIDALADDLSDGAAGDDSNVTKVLADAMKDANLANNLTDSSGVYTPPANIPVSEIAAAKALFRELRTQTMSVVDYKHSGTPGFLDNEAANISDALEHTTLDVEYIATAIGHFFDAIGNMKKNNLSNFIPSMPEGFMGTGLPIYWSAASSTNFNYTIGTAEYNGTFILPQNIDTLNLADISVPITATISGTLPPLKMGELSQSFDATAQLSKTNTVATLEVNASVYSGNETIRISNLEAQAFLEENGDLSYLKLNTLGLQAVKGDYNFNGLLQLSSYVRNHTVDIEGHYIPSALSFDGTIADQSNESSLNGNISMVLKNAADINFSSEEEPLFSINTTGRLKMPDHPVLNVMLGVENVDANRNDYNLSYSYDSVVVNGTAKLDSDEENGTVDFTSTNGLHIHIVLVNGEIDTARSSVTKDGNAIGHFEKRNDLTIIKYIDGTFESLL